MTSDVSELEPAEVFVSHRGLLFGVAYRMLGSVSDAEDVVQDAWLRWREVDHDAVDDPRSYLVAVASRLAVDRYRQAKTRRESYVGEWLPEPLLTEPDAAHAVELGESVSLAMLVVLETLSPLERIVFVLREAFDYSYQEIAEVVGRSEDACRQLASRARTHVTERTSRYDTDSEAQRRVAERFLAAATGSDVEGLLALLAPDVELHSDAGGKAKAPLRTIVGADKVARFLAAIAQDPPYVDPVIRLANVNGAPAIVATEGGAPATAFTIDIRDGRIQRMQLFANPDKLSGLRRGSK